MSLGKVSVITPLFNSEEFIGDTIESVLAQSYPHWEMIIVDDCSTDDGVKVVEHYSSIDSRIKLVLLEKNSGAAVARNTALEYAKGRFIAFLDSDDIWNHDKLKLQLEFMTENDYPISFTSYEIIKKSGEKVGNVIRAPNKLNQKEYLMNTAIGFSTSAIDLKRLRGKVEFINLRTRQDTSLWITLLGQKNIAYGIDRILVKYRVHENSISANKLKAAKQVWKLYYDVHKFGLMKSVYYFAFYAFNAVKKRISNV